MVRRLAAQSRLDSEDVDRAVLLASETVTNAIIHGRSDVQVTVTPHQSGLLVEVADDNSRHPVRRSPDPDALDGRGIGLLDACATRWGVRDETIGKTVWFEVVAAARTAS